MTATARGVGGSREAEEVIEVVVDISTSPAVRVGPVMAMRSAMGVGLAAADVRPVLAIGVATTCGAAFFQHESSEEVLFDPKGLREALTKAKQAAAEVNQKMQLLFCAMSEHHPGYKMLKFICETQCFFSRPADSTDQPCSDDQR
uniref:Uncharacterized protein n=1 Tax=Oryza brachyantha TaxID=4533 RepID=J3M1E6_ORYBR